MPQGDKRAYTAKQIRKARDIEQTYEERGVSEKESERRAWATVNKRDGGGLKAGAHDASANSSGSRAGGKSGMTTTRRSAGTSVRTSSATRAQRSSRA